MKLHMNNEKDKKNTRSKYFTLFKGHVFKLEILMEFHNYNDLV